MFITPPFLIDKQAIYHLAEWIAAGIALMLGLHYFREILAYVLSELYQMFIQRGVFPV